MLATQRGWIRAAGGSSPTPALSRSMGFQPIVSSPDFPPFMMSRAGRGMPSRFSSSPQRPTGAQRMQASIDPWRELGVSATADEAEIKRAHRKLVLEHHPDVAAQRGDPTVHARFIAIQEAYEILMGRRRYGSDAPPGTQKDSWDFHDWFWKFNMRRRWGRGSADAPPPPPHGHAWKTQLHGLKQRAAARKWNRQRNPGYESSDGEEEMAAVRTSPTAATAAALAAEQAQMATATEPKAAAREDFMRHFTHSTSSSRSTAALAPEPLAAQMPNISSSDSGIDTQGKDLADSQQQQQHAELGVLDRALHMVTSVCQAGTLAHDAVLQEHTDTLVSQVVAFGRQLRSSLAMPQYAGGISMEAGRQQEQRVPGLHTEFEAMRHVEQNMQAAAGAAGHTEVGAPAPASEEAADAPAGQASAASGAQHAQHSSYASQRHFNPSSDHKSRISSQLAGLRRKAGLKQEVGWEDRSE